MQLNPIIEELRERCPVFANRIAGAAEFKMLDERASLAVPFAFVIPLDDSPESQQSGTGYRQTLKEGFGVVVAVSNVSDEKGQNSTASIHNLRATLWAALLGWQPSDRHDAVVYEGGQLMGMDRARLWYQFDFSAKMEIETSDTWQATDLANLPAYEGGTVKIDLSDPRDPNAPGESPGPDGRMEGGFVYPKSGNFPPP
jgi:hypothetical protein